MIKAVHVPTSVDDTLAALGRAGDAARVLGGGTVMMAIANTVGTAGIAATELVSLRSAGVSGVVRDGRRLRVGAATTLTALEYDGPDVLRPAIATIASPTVRNTATVGGNLFVRSPYGDLAACLIALRATVDVASGAGIEQRPVDQVVAGGVAAGEFVTAVSFDVPDATGWRYVKAMRRKHNSGAIVTVAAALTFDGDTITAAGIGLGALAPKPIRSAAAEAALVGGRLDAETVAAAAQAAEADIAPFDDAYASAWYRRRVFPVHFRRALLGA